MDVNVKDISAWPVTEGQGEGANWDRLAVAPVGSAYLIDADEANPDGPALIYGFQFIAGSGTLTLDIYDAASATGDPVFKGLAAGYTIGTIVTFPCAIKCVTKPFCDIGGTSPKVRLYAVPLTA